MRPDPSIDRCRTQLDGLGSLEPTLTQGVPFLAEQLARQIDRVPALFPVAASNLHDGRRANAVTAIAPAADEADLDLLERTATGRRGKRESTNYRLASVARASAQWRAVRRVANGSSADHPPPFEDWWTTTR